MPLVLDNPVVLSDLEKAQERLSQLDTLAPVCRWDLMLCEIPIANYQATVIARKLWQEILDTQNDWEIAMGY